jgi:hypothetical protein
VSERIVGRAGKVDVKGALVSSERLIEDFLVGVARLLKLRRTSLRRMFPEIGETELNFLIENIRRVSITLHSTLSLREHHDLTFELCDVSGSRRPWPPKRRKL